MKTGLGDSGWPCKICSVQNKTHHYSPQEYYRMKTLLDVNNQTYNMKSTEHNQYNTLKKPKE